MPELMHDRLQAASLIIVGNLPDKTRFTFANAIRGAVIKFGDIYEVKRVVILETTESMKGSNGREQVIRSILGSACSIISVPCIDDFRLRAFQTIAEELRRRDIQGLIVDITNGRRDQTFDLIVATSICRIDNVIMTTVPRDCFEMPYDELDGGKYNITTIRPFSKDPSLEAAAQFELFYYTDRVRESIDMVRGSRSDSIAGYANTIERGLTNAIINYFSDEPDNLDNALKRLFELHEGIARRLAREVSGTSPRSGFFDFVEIIRNELSEPAKLSVAEEDVVDEDRLSAVMLADLFDLSRKFRNYLAHPYHRRIRRSEVRLMIFATFTILEQIAAVVSWQTRIRNDGLHIN